MATVPKPRTRMDVCYCPESGCTYKSEKSQSYRMHWLQKHSPTFRASVQAASHQKAQSTQPATSKTSKKKVTSLHSFILNILQSHTRGSMRKSELLTAIRSSGFQTTMADAQLLTYLAQRVRVKPNGGIIQPSPGVFALGPANQDYRYKSPQHSTLEVQQPALEVQQVPNKSTVPLQVENEILRRQKQKAQEIIMKMSELLLLAVD